MQSFVRSQLIFIDLESLDNLGITFTVSTSDLTISGDSDAYCGGCSLQ